MAAKFKKGDTVKLAVVVPQGPVLALRMLDDGTVQYCIEWVDGSGQTQQRWFDENELVSA
jgi:uncharacterized protein YodC (DUF2158 family)